MTLRSLIQLSVCTLCTVQFISSLTLYEKLALSSVASPGKIRKKPSSEPSSPQTNSGGGSENTPRTIPTSFTEYLILFVQSSLSSSSSSGFSSIFGSPSKEKKLLNLVIKDFGNDKVCCVNLPDSRAPQVCPDIYTFSLHNSFFSFRHRFRLLSKRRT